jgi:hypothetical protein
VSRYEPQCSGLTFIEFGIDDVDVRHPALSALVGRGKHNFAPIVYNSRSQRTHLLRPRATPYKFRLGDAKTRRDLTDGLTLLSSPAHCSKRSRFPTKLSETSARSVTELPLAQSPAAYPRADRRNHGVQRSALASTGLPGASPLFCEQVSGILATAGACARRGRHALVVGREFAIAGIAPIP